VKQLVQEVPVKYHFNISDARTWFYYPIQMPLDKEGRGPAFPPDIETIEYQVWDRYLDCHGTHKYLPDAINQAVKLNLEHEKQKTPNSN
jgi:hypothetical protein